MLRAQRVGLGERFVLRQSVTAGWSSASTATNPVWRFSLLATLGDTTYFLAEGVTFGGGGTARYNFPESPHSFWSYRPA